MYMHTPLTDGHPARPAIQHHRKHNNKQSSQTLLFGKARSMNMHTPLTDGHPARPSIQHHRKHNNKQSSQTHPVGIPAQFLLRSANDTCGIRTHAGRPHRLSRPTP